MNCLKPKKTLTSLAMCLCITSFYSRDAQSWPEVVTFKVSDMIANEEIHKGHCSIDLGGNPQYVGWIGQEFSVYGKDYTSHKNLVFRADFVKQSRKGDRQQKCEWIDDRGKKMSLEEFENTHDLVKNTRWAISVSGTYDSEGKLNTCIWRAWPI
jgi:hypothetical protein